MTGSTMSAKKHYTTLPYDSISSIFAKKLAGVGSRRIAQEILGSRTKKSTVNYIFNSIINNRLMYVLDGKYTLFSMKKVKPRILVLDIETAPLRAALWSMWQQGVGLNMIEKDWYILAFAAKWFGEPEDSMVYMDMRGHAEDEDDSALLDKLWKMLNEADFVLTQNGVKFDDKKIKARFVMNGYRPPASYRHIDTLQIAKREFGFTSNKLEYMTDKLCVKYKKLKHGKFAGYNLWKECLAENPEAWEEMERYNRYDVLSLEELYEILRPWDRKHPNFNLYTPANVNTCRCGSTNLAKDGFAYTNLSKFQRFKCRDCGAESRDRKNLLTKDKSAILQSNIL